MDILETVKVKAGLTVMVGAILVDLHAFSKAKSFNKIAKFDWRLALTRYGSAFMVGYLSGIN